MLKRAKRNLPEPQEYAQICCLKGGNLEGRVFPLKQDQTFGRSDDCDIVLADESQSVSRRHGRFEVRQEQVSIRDLGSTNGITVNGERVDHRLLTNGDRIGIGKEFEFAFISAKDSQGFVSEPSLPERRTQPDASPGKLMVLIQTGMVVLAFVGLAIVFKPFSKPEPPPPPKEVEVEEHTWSPASGNLGITLTVPFNPTKDPFAYDADVLVGTHEVYSHRFAEVSGTLLMDEKPVKRVSRIGFFIDVITCLSADWPYPREPVFENKPIPRAVFRSRKNTTVLDEREREFKGVWNGTDPQVFKVVQSRVRFKGSSPRDGLQSLDLVELYTWVPYHRIIVGTVVPSKDFPRLQHLVGKSLKSVRLDEKLRTPPSHPRDLELSNAYLRKADLYYADVEVVPENLYQAILHLRKCIWHRPPDAADLETLKTRLTEWTKQLDARYRATNLELFRADQQIGRTSSIRRAVELIIREIPDPLDSRVRFVSRLFPEVRQRFPNLKWHHDLLERIRLQ